MTAFSGLNLTPEVAECILKHTYCQTGVDALSADTIYHNSKHSDFIPAGYCHLEGQAVRLADKISYFVSDLEDGIRLSAITASDLLSCRFFHRAPLNFAIPLWAIALRQFHCAATKRIENSYGGRLGCHEQATGENDAPRRSSC
jgi:dGTP triphosphohydrolase